MKKTSIALLMVFCIGCSQVQQGSVSKDAMIGETLQAKQYGDIYFSAQPSKTDFSKLKEQGFSAVVNLRTSEEYDETQELKNVKKNNLSYFHYPLNMKNLNDLQIETVAEAVNKHRKNGKVLVHCSSGNRAAVWAGGYFFKDKNYSAEQSVQMAEDLGLTNQVAMEKLKSYLNLNK